MIEIFYNKKYIFFYNNLQNIKLKKNSYDGETLATHCLFSTECDEQLRKG